MGKFKKGDEVVLVNTDTKFLRAYIGQAGNIVDTDSIDNTVAIDFHDGSGGWWFKESDVELYIDYDLSPGDLSGLFNQR